MDNNFKCPSCGGELQASENGFFVCQACGKAFRRAERAPQTSERPTSVQQTEPPVQQPAEQPAAEQQQPATASQPAEPAYAAYGAPQPAYQGAGEAAQPTTPADVYTPARKGYVKGRWWVSRLSMGLLMLLISVIVTGLCFGVVGDAVMSAISGIIGLGACAFATAILAMALISRNNEVSVGAWVGMSIANCALTLISVICATIPLATSTSAALVIVPVVLVAFFEAIGIMSMTQACDLWNASALSKMTFGKKSFTTRNEELNSYENRRSWMSLFIPVVYGVLALVVALIIVFGSSSVTDPLRKADEVRLGMGRYDVTNIIGEYAERDGESDIDSSVYVWYDAEYAALVDDAKSLFNKLKNCGDAEEALSIMQQIVDIEEEMAGRAYTKFTVEFEDGRAVRMSLVNLFPEDGDLTGVPAPDVCLAQAHIALAEGAYTSVISCAMTALGIMGTAADGADDGRDELARSFQLVIAAAGDGAAGLAGKCLASFATPDDAKRASGTYSGLSTRLYLTRPIPPAWNCFAPCRCPRAVRPRRQRPGSERQSVFAPARSSRKAAGLGAYPPCGT